ncbi:hypothetical protein HG531_009628 [Fusarium graminearum]|nr:hypothetical protein HG531_009628 [Fusarium graminearum]
MVVSLLLRSGIAASFAALLIRSVRGRRGQASSDRSETPLLDVGLDEDETSLSEVDVNSSRAVCTDGREEVLCLETVDYLFELLAIAREEDSTGSRTVTHANNIALYQWGTIFLTGHVVHDLEGLGLITRECLLIIVFTWSTKAIENNATGTRAAGNPEDKDDQSDEDDGSEG